MTNLQVSSSPSDLKSNNNLGSEGSENMLNPAAKETNRNRMKRLKRERDTPSKSEGSAAARERHRAVHRLWQEGRKPLQPLSKPV